MFIMKYLSFVNKFRSKENCPFMNCNTPCVSFVFGGFSLSYECHLLVVK